MFGVYLLHDNPNIRHLIWLKWLDSANYINSRTFLLRLAISCILVFLIGICVEFMRRKLTAKFIACFCSRIAR